jgi:hypothetical protein
MTTVGVGVAAMKTGTNDVSGRCRWCPNLSTSFFFFVFYNMPHLLLPRLKMGFTIPLYLPGSLASPSMNYFSCSFSPCSPVLQPLQLAILFLMIYLYLLAI